MPRTKKAASKKVQSKKTPKAKKAKKAAETISKSSMVRSNDIPTAALKLIQKADAAEMRLLDLQDDLQKVLLQLTEALGSSSFEHPDRGPMSVMQRNDKYFWRAKPVGPRKAA